LEIGMSDSDWLAERFEENRAHLRAVAYRILGATGDTDDAVQETWLRLSRSDTSAVENLRGWLTTVVARVCLDILRARKSRHEEPLTAQAAPGDDRDLAATPEQEALLADSIGPALVLVLDTLAPAERVAFVLHDLFGVSFDEIAPIVGRSSAAARQLASRGRRRVQGASAEPGGDRTRQREIVSAFLAAARHGELEPLLALLDPDVVLTADALAVETAAANQRHGAPTIGKELRGARAVAEAFKGRARGAQAALIEGNAGAAWVQGGQLRALFAFTVDGDKIVAIDLVMDPAHLEQIEVQLGTP
jgi:RNA polymerase sigma-70 factor (ECF subfamily)